jgi:hypothetical protein
MGGHAAKGAPVGQQHVRAYRQRLPAGPGGSVASTPQGGAAHLIAVPRRCRVGLDHGRPAGGW